MWRHCAEPPDHGVCRGDTFAQYLYNGVEYLESIFVVFRLLVPVNTNYRYGDDELVYLFDNADAAAVVFHGAFTDRSPASASSAVRFGVGCGSTTEAGPCPDWAVAYADATPLG